jgi:hypothetical protein
MGVQIQPWHNEQVYILPLFAWYDYTFGSPSTTIQRAWMDFKHCQWPMDLPALTVYFLERNTLPTTDLPIISFSHFMPRSDLLPPGGSKIVQTLLPVFGSERLGEQVAQVGSRLHIYGHHHLNRSVQLDGTWFLNNAFGYPHETQICRRELLPVFREGNVVTGTKQWPTMPRTIKK